MFSLLLEVHVLSTLRHGVFMDAYLCTCSITVDMTVWSAISLKETKESYITMYKFTVLVK